jgi:DNA adenine methylase
MPTRVLIAVPALFTTLAARIARAAMHMATHMSTRTRRHHDHTPPGRPRFAVPGLEQYFGSKGSQGTFQRIINAIPPHDVYIEPFLGAGRIFRIKRPAPLGNYGLELSFKVVNLWLPACPAAYTVSQANAFEELPRLVAQLQAAGIDPLRVVVYCDPPYLLSTRRDPRPTYEHEFTEAGHVAFLAMVHALPCRVLVSHLPCELYATSLRSWHTFTFNNTTRHGLQLEQVWCNFPPSPELHEYTYIGSNFREREWIRRQYGIILRRVAALPAPGRIALRAMLDARDVGDEDPVT